MKRQSFQNIRLSSPAMDDLPSWLLVEILSRLNDSADLARCRVVSKTLNSLSREVRSIHLLCTFDRYIKSRSPETKSLTTPFKSIFKNLVRNTTNLESVSVGVEKPLRGIPYDDVEDELDDLYLTDANFVSEWLPAVSGGLRSLSISDFWVQSCWRRSEVLALISSYCHSLLQLEVKNAWLSVDGLNKMTMLTSLTLEFIRLDDEDLSKVNDCFPSLQVLNLMGVGGLKEPRINLLHLKTCHWTVSNAPLSLTILAPMLVKLKLKCVRPKSLVLKTPLLSDLNLSLEMASEFAVKEFLNLKTLQLESSSLGSLIATFRNGSTIEKLSVDSLKWNESSEKTRVSLGRLLDVFPSVSSLTLGPGAWSEVATCFHGGELEGSSTSTGVNKLKEIKAYVVIGDIDVTLNFICYVLDKFVNLSDMALLINRGVDSYIAYNLISRCASECRRVRWRWGTWKEGTQDAWVSDSI